MFTYGTPNIRPVGKNINNSDMADENDQFITIHTCNNTIGNRTAGAMRAVFHHLQTLIVIPLLPIYMLAQTSACSIGCPNDSNVLGYATLADLKCKMNEDSLSMQASPAYTLCPNTVFQDGTIITPLLENTIITCGIDGSSANECIVKGGEVQVDIIAAVAVSFHGVTFSSQDGSNDGGNETISIRASGTGDGVATFIDCHWTNMTNRMAILNTAKTTAMTMTLKYCSFTDTDSSIYLPAETTGIVSVNGKITMENCIVQNYNVSRFLDLTKSNATLSNTQIVDNTLKGGFLDFILLSSGSIELTNITAQYNTFSNFLWVQSAGVAQVSGSAVLQNIVSGSIVRMTSTAASVSLVDTFLHGRSFALITVSGLGGSLRLERCVLDSDQSMHAIYSFSNTTLVNSCVHGQTTFPPIFISGPVELLTSENVFEDVHVRDANCTGIFVEEIGDSCFYPSDDDKRVCDGRCIAADSTSCFDAQLPSIPSCDISCQSNTDKRCIGSLLELKCTMCAEAVTIAAGRPYREAPYVYQLCENTIYEVVEEMRDTIYPILNDTNIICGPNGDLVSNCTIVGGFLQVEISETSRDAAFLTSPVPLEYMLMEGFVFKQVKVDPRIRISPSVWARGGLGVIAEFRSCLWTEIGGTHSILNQNPTDFGNLDGSASGAMSVIIADSVFSFSLEGSRHKGIQTSFGDITLQGVEMVEYSTVKETIGVFNKANMRIVDSRFANNTMAPGDGSKAFIYVEGDSLLRLADSIFSGILPCSPELCLLKPGGVIIGVNSDIIVKRSIFEGIVAQVVVGVTESDLSITDSCFIAGNQVIPVYSTDYSISKFERNYGRDLMTTCAGLFIGECMDPSTTGCIGDCVPFDGTSCTAVAPPSLSPTVSMSPSKVGETGMPSAIPPAMVQPSASDTVGFARVLLCLGSCLLCSLLLLV